MTELLGLVESLGDIGRSQSEHNPKPLLSVFGEFQALLQPLLTTSLSDYNRSQFLLLHITNCLGVRDKMEEL